MDKDQADEACAKLDLGNPRDVAAEEARELLRTQWKRK